MSWTILWGGRVIDCVNPGYRDATLVVESGRIASVEPGSGVEPRQGDILVDLRGAAVLPGLWDIHTHLESLVGPVRPTGPEISYQYAYEARRGLTEAGIVGIRTGPRILAGGYFLTTQQDTSLGRHGPGSVTDRLGSCPQSEIRSKPVSTT